MLVDVPELLVRCGSEEKIQVPKSFTVCCVRGFLTAAMLSVLCFDVEFPENGIGFLFFTLLLPSEPSSSQNLTIAF